MFIHLVKPPLGQLQDVDTNSNVEFNNQNRTPKNSSIKQPQYPTLPNKPTQSENEPTLKPNKNQALSKNEISPRNSIREPLVTKENELNIKSKEKYDNQQSYEDFDTKIKNSYAGTFNRGTALNVSFRSDDQDIKVYSEEPSVKPISSKPVQPISYSGEAQEYINLIYQDRKQFATIVPPKDHTFLCRITRDRSGLGKGMYPTYYLHLEKDGTKKVIKCSQIIDLDFSKFWRFFLRYSC